MPHLTRKPGDTVRVGAWWYHDYDEYLDIVAEYEADERASKLDDEERD